MGWQGGEKGVGCRQPGSRGRQAHIPKPQPPSQLRNKVDFKGWLPARQAFSSACQQALTVATTT